MPEQWIIRVEGKDYGPAAIATLQEWKNEGRVLPSNAARRLDLDHWVTAANIPGLFETVAPPVQVPAPAITPGRSLGQILVQTVQIYFKGFFSYLGLTFLVIGPSICARLTTALVESTPNVDNDLRQLVEGGFELCMLLLWLAMLPIYIAGIQILTTELARGERIGFFKVLNGAIKFWVRVTFLCLFVYGSYAFWSILLLLFSFGILLSNPNFLSIFVSLVLLSLWIWIIGRLWVTFLFWQQFAVIENCNIGETLRRSKELARSGDDLAWLQRPLWRGVFITSLWFALVLGMYWLLLSRYVPTMATPSDPQVLMQSWRTAAESLSTNRWFIALGFAQEILHPLLGVAFVLLYLDSTTRGSESDQN